MADDTDRSWKELLELMREFVSRRHEEAQKTLLVKIHHENYPISCEVLNQVFSRFGVIEKLEQSSPELGFHSKVCFKNGESALMALNSFNGKHIYDGCCRLQLSLSAYTRDRSSEFEAPIEGMRQVEPAISESEISAQDSGIEVDEDCAIQFESSTAQLTETGMDHVKSLRGSTEHQIEDSHLQTEAHENRFVQVEKQPFPDAYHLFDEMPMEDESEILQDNCSVDLTNASAKDSLGIEHLNLHPENFEASVMNQVFVKCQAVVEVDEYVNMLRTFGNVSGSIESIGSFVFDPGKKQCIQGMSLGEFLGFVSRVAKGS